MTAKNASQIEEVHSTAAQRETTDLDRCYGEIGIEAVAAAARYTGGSRKPAGAQPAAQIDQRFIELAI